MSDDEIIPLGAIVLVQMRVRVPISATDEQVEDWLRFELGRQETMSAGNPLESHELEGWGLFSFDWDYTGKIGVIEEREHYEIDAPG